MKRNLQFVLLLVCVLSLGACDLLRNTNNKTKDRDELAPVVGSRTARDSAANNKQPIKPIKPALVRVDTIREFDTLDLDNKRYVVSRLRAGEAILRVDTLQKIELRPEFVLPEIRKKSSYNIVLIMPFLSDEQRGTEINPKSLRALEFYEGVKLALEDLRKEGLTFRFFAFDSKRDDETVQAILQKEALQNADLIIGPVGTTALAQVAEFALEKQIPLISPFNPLEHVSKDNPFYIQLNPSYASHSKALIDYVEGELGGYNKRFLVIATTQDSQRVEDLQDAYRIAKNDYNASLPLIMLEEGKYRVEESRINSFLSQDAMNIVILPSYQKEHFVQDVLRTLSSSFGDRPHYDAGGNPKPRQRRPNTGLLVMGMQAWKFYEKINFDVYEFCNLHISDAFFVDEQSSAIKKFRERYFKSYGIAPRDFAYTGYDATLYFGRILKNEGTAIIHNLEKDRGESLHTHFAFSPVYLAKKTEQGDAEILQSEFPEARIQRYENCAVHILKFEDFRFKKVKTKQGN